MIHGEGGLRQGAGARLPGRSSTWTPGEDTGDQRGALCGQQAQCLELARATPSASQGFGHPRQPWWGVLGTRYREALGSQIEAGSLSPPQGRGPHCQSWSINTTISASWSPSPRRREDSQARALLLLKLVPASTVALSGVHTVQGLEKHTPGGWRGMGGPQEGCPHPASIFASRRMSQPGARLT